MMQKEKRQCQKCKIEFIIEPEDFAFYEKMQVPAPTFCPQCRFQRRLTFENERSLYHRKCDLCAKNIVSTHQQDKELTVYCNTCWWSDKWDALDYGMTYDPSRPFLLQLKELYRKTPQMALACSYPTLVNSDYVNLTATAKNCYLIFISDECENVLYSEMLLHDKDCMDISMSSYTELSYWLINCVSCYRTFFSEDCENCQEVYFSKDLNGCNNCIGCIGLRNKSYHIFNKPYSKEAYQAKLKEFKLDSSESIEALKQEALRFWQKYPHKFAHELGNFNVTGDYAYKSKNAKNMYFVRQGAEDCRYCQIVYMPPLKDAYDYTIWGMGAQRIYECITVGEGADMIKFSYSVWPNVRDIEYCLMTLSSSFMFGCANIRNKKYCILNKQYSKEVYETLRKKIIEDMNKNPYMDKGGKIYAYGEFPPPELSLFSYNESYAMDYFPLTQEEAGNQGFSWYEATPPSYKPTITSQEIPDSINDINDAITQEIIECGGCKKSFRIVSQELLLLRRFGLPAPRKCPNCRYRERRSRINPPSLCHRICQCRGAQSENNIYPNKAEHFHKKEKCPNEFETSYSPNRREIVYCKECYQREVA